MVLSKARVASGKHRGSIWSMAAFHGKDAKASVKTQQGGSAVCEGGLACELYHTTSCFQKRSQATNRKYQYSARHHVFLTVLHMTKRLETSHFNRKDGNTVDDC